MNKTVAALLAGSAILAAAPASAGTFVVEVGAPNPAPNGGGNDDTPKFRVANTTPGSATTPTISSLVLTLPAGSLGTITNVTNFGQGDWAPGEDDAPSMSSVGSGQIDYGAGNKSVTLNYVGGKFDPGAYSAFSVNFGPGSNQNFRNLLFPGATLVATFSDASTATVNFSSTPVSTTATSYVFESMSGAVPEPATWALMILGFGLVGGVMRSSQRQQARIRFA